MKQVCTNNGYDCFNNPFNSINKEFYSHLKFFFFGCWGVSCNISNQKTGQVQVKNLMKELNNDHNFILCAGDNRYPKYYDEEILYKYGIDLDYFMNFLDCYSGLDLPWYIALGNHDTSKCQTMNGQVNFTYLPLLKYPTLQNKDIKISNIWNLPSPYWSSYYENINGASVNFLFIDTSSIIDELSYLSSPPLSKEKEEEKKLSCNVIRNHKELKSIKENFEKRVPTDIMKQLKWFLEQLNTRKATYNIVIGHHPIYANGHKKNKTFVQNEELLPFLQIMKENNVQLYMCADEHNMQFLHDDNISFVINGAGGTDLDKDIYLAKELKDMTKFIYSEKHGIVDFYINEEFISLKFINVDNEILKEIKINKKGKIIQ